MSEFSAIKTEDPFELHLPLTESHKTVGSYRPATGLREAADVAMRLGVPLLLSGPPGTGKTRAAYWLADRLKRGKPLRFDVKSGTSGTDLLYHFDEVARFRDSTRKVERPLVHYLRFNALGEAILRAAGGNSPLETIVGRGSSGSDDESERRLQGKANLDRNAELLEEAFGKEWKPIDGAARVAHLLPRDETFRAAPATPLVVLVDEIDKAPRDTPNDLLMELEEMRFSIPELGLAVRGSPKVRPIVVITSNAEKSLPEPFLRRCAFFAIPYPEGDDLRAIVSAVLGEDTRERALNPTDLVAEVIEFFEYLRAPDNEGEIGRIPGTAELLGWIDVLRRQPGVGPDASLRDRIGPREKPVYGMGCLLKGKDLEVGEELIRRWAGVEDG